MSYENFLTMLGLLVLLTWAVQFVVFHLLTLKRGFAGASFPRTLKAAGLIAVCGAATNLLFSQAPGSALPASAVGLVGMIVLFGGSVAIVRWQYGARVSRAALVVAIPGILGLAGAWTIRASFAQAFRVPTAAMAPALVAGDHFLALKYAGRSGEPERGDVVVFEHPRDRNLDYIKRVMGLPGEAIEIRDRELLVDGRPVADPWGIHGTVDARRAADPRYRDYGPVVVPPGEYFMLGDNRDQSMDSRFFGPVPRDLLVGKAMLRYKPVSRWGRVP